ncbi:hypothetical protein DBR06_SOUSAS11710051, partial [Sousa chinensis]
GVRRASTSRKRTLHGGARGRAEILKGFKQENVANEGVYLGRRRKSQENRPASERIQTQRKTYPTCIGDVWIYFGRRAG